MSEYIAQATPRSPVQPRGRRVTDAASVSLSSNVRNKQLSSLDLVRLFNRDPTD
jgi:hypothetical protein